jgi:serine/threonine protein kinase/WD40 repeat protein
MDEPKQNADSGPSREAALFQAAAQLSGADRAAFLDRACGGDAALRKRLEALLSGHGQSEGALAEPAPPAEATMKLESADAPDESVGQKIGRYKILEKIGEGGCGVVYVAEQTEPVRRRVALKVIKLGMDTKQVVARFGAERQALAMMDHPNIAKVLDAGATEFGRPYFIMELVRGIRITDYCDQNKLPTAERIELFIKICQAIQHAHQKGIIHRDIKPSNILVTLHDGVPVPKVIDFGIAKATEGRLTDATVYTQLHQFIGTPAYMSPEQAEMSGLDIDTRSDIYSLGVLLYELLTGRTPFDARELMQAGLDAMRKVIREREPLRPSTKVATLKGEELTTTAARRAAEAPRLISLLRGDLDWIVMKCLEKDRTRRYETANGLAVDLKRHLTNEPIAARAPSQIYRFEKSLRRNKLAFAAFGAVICALILGIVASAWQAIRATRAREEALAARATETLERQKAEANERNAVAAEEAEAQEELAARQRAYASDMNAVSPALAADNLGKALQLLDRQRPQKGQKDLRGWEWRYLWQQCRSDALLTLCHRAGEIDSLAVSSDGHWMAIGPYHAGEGTVVWDLRTREEVFTTATNLSYVRVAFSPVDNMLAIAGEDISSNGWFEKLRLCDPTAQRTLAEIPLDSLCMGLGFSQDGRSLVTSTTGHLTLWHVPDLTMQATYPSRLEGQVAGSPFATTTDLSLAAYAEGGNPQKISVVDLRTGRELWAADGAPQWVTALAFSSNGKTLASGGGFGESDIRLWDVASGKQIEALKGHSSWVSSLLFWPDGKSLASASADRTIRIWDLASGQTRDVLRGHQGEVWRLALLPDNETLVSGSKDGTVCLWDASVSHQRKPNLTWPDKIAGWCFGPGDSVLTLDDQGQLARSTGSDFHQTERMAEFGTNIAGFCFSHDGRLLGVSSSNGVISVWDVAHGTLCRRVTTAPNYANPDALDAIGNKLITLDSSPSTRFHEWDLVTGSEIQSWTGPGGFAFALSPDGQSCVIVGYEREAVLRNLDRQASVSLSLDVLEAHDASISPDGKLLAVASDLGYDRVWSTADWHEVATLRGYLLGSHSAVFSSDGTRLATGNGADDEALKLWDTASWQDVLTLKGSGTVFTQPAFSLDGNCIGVLSDGGTLNIWRAPSWAEIEAAEKTNPSLLTE